MNKLKKTTIVLLIIAFSCSISVFATNAVNYYSAIKAESFLSIDTQPLYFKNPLVTINDTLYVPIREFCEQQGMEVSWMPLKGVFSDVSIQSSEKPNTITSLFSLIKIFRNEKIYIKDVQFARKKFPEYSYTETFIVMEVDKDYMHDSGILSGTEVSLDEYEEKKDKITTICSENNINIEKTTAIQQYFTYLFENDAQKQLIVNKIIGQESTENNKVNVVLFMNIPDGNYVDNLR